jgi:hypothetical protein
MNTVNSVNALRCLKREYLYDEWLAEERTASFQKEKF